MAAPRGPSCSDRLGDKPTELELCEHVTLDPLVVSKWMLLCQKLGLTQREIEAVQKDRGSDPSEVLFQCLRVWIEEQCEVHKPPTWETLLKALALAGLSEVAKRIAFEFLKIENPLTRKPTRRELQELVVGSNLLLIPQYERICRLLGVKSSEIDMAKKDHPNENKMAFLKCLHIWLDGRTQVAVNWETLLGVLEKAGYQEHVVKVKRELLFEGCEESVETASETAQTESTQPHQGKQTFQPLTNVKKTQKEVEKFLNSRRTVECFEYASLKSFAGDLQNFGLIGRGERQEMSLTKTTEVAASKVVREALLNDPCTEKLARLSSILMEDKSYHGNKDLALLIQQFLST